MDRFKSRKFLLCLLIVILAFIALALAWIDQQVFYQLVRDVGWGYITGNVASTAADALAKKKAPEGALSPGAAPG